jgi:PRTRC genetic system protein C
MANVIVAALPRELYLNDETRLPDPSPDLPVEQVQDMLTTAYPELATAKIEGPIDTGKALRFTFRLSIGSKG